MSNNYLFRDMCLGFDPGIGPDGRVSVYTQAHLYIYSHECDRVPLVYICAHIYVYTHKCIRPASYTTPECLLLYTYTPHAHLHMRIYVCVYVRVAICIYTCIADKV